ncbi:MAG TPA: hypothetical protein VFL47_02405 [Flavisolibacter sp.]|nr:hypothetical protein [Flavisolibacter sp.]
MADHVCLIIRLDKVEHLQGPEDFLDPAQKEIAVSAKNATAEPLSIGKHIVCKIRKAPGRFFIIPDSIVVTK